MELFFWIEIRLFSGKMGILAKRIIQDYENVSIKPEELAGRMDFAQFFGGDGPVHIEIGSGKGTFLVSEAKALKDVNFLGIEYARKYYRYAVDRIGRWGLGNVRIIRTEAAVFLKEHIADGSVSWFHIYFPDPWPKKRHHKRRFICKANLQEMLRCLAGSGVINIATDHFDYFEQMKTVIGDAAGKVEQIEFTPSAVAGDGLVTGTNYERKYLKDGRDIYTIAVRKVE